MLGMSKLRIALTVMGFILLGLFIWFAGPYFAFVEWHPFESATARITLICVVIGLWVAYRLYKLWRSRSKSAALMTAVAQQPDEGATASPDARQMRERFEEAAATLKAKPGSQSLYELPWYVIIGAPGSGKTTVLVNSGLRLPLGDRYGREGLKGVGGTRNCAWLFTDEAVFLDTAGRFTTQDSDARSDAAGWKEFLALLKKFRTRRPVNGVILAVSAADLMTQSAADREGHIAAARRRLEELNSELRIVLPVYLLVTKCDLIAGFAEYFDDLTPEGRAQVWGVTFPYAETRSGAAVRSFATQFDRLMERLNSRVFERLEAEHDTRRRGRIFGFPQQMAALRELVSQYVTEVFSSTRFDQKVMLRGAYFTSGTQEGTPIDRLLGTLSRSLGLRGDAVANVASGRGKAYFIQALLRDVLLGESGLAGIDRRVEFRQGALQLAAYVGTVVLTVLSVIGLMVSLSRNQGYLREVATQVSALDKVPPVGPTAPLEGALPRLDAVSQVDTVAEQYRDGAPLSMRFGLFQGNSVGNAAHDAYLRELDGVLLPRIMERVRQRLVESAAAPDQLYEYLKAYLMFGHPEHLDPVQLGAIADLEWARAYPSDADTRQSLSKHFHALLAAGRPRALSIDDSLAAQARSTIRQSSIARLMYSRLKLDYVGDNARDLQLDVAAGLGADQVFQRKSGVSMATPVPAFYTRKVFTEATTTGTVELVKQFAADSWVLGSDALTLKQSTQLTTDVINLYEHDYIDQWEHVLADVQLAPFQTLDRTTAALGILAAPTSSPLRGLLQVVDTNTHLVPGPGEAPQGTVAVAQQAISNRIGKLLDAGKAMAGVAPAPTPGAQVTQHFAGLHQALTGPPGTPAGGAPIDRVLGTIGQLQQQLMAVGTGAGDRNPLEQIAQAGGGNLAKSLQAEASLLPPSVGTLIAQVGGRSEGVTLTQARTELEMRFQQNVVQECNAVTRGRYPFSPRSTLDVPLADFGRLFAFGGVFDTFFKDNLSAIVDTARRPWVWRAGSDGASIGASLAMLREFEAAQQIRDDFFHPGAQVPDLHFTVTPAALDTDATRVLVEIDGQSFEYRHGPERSWPAAWPGPAPGAAAVSFEDRAGTHPNLSFQGPWALFRLLDAGQVRGANDVHYTVNFQLATHSAQLSLEAASIHNPFGKHDLSGFHCGT